MWHVHRQCLQVLSSHMGLPAALQPARQGWCQRRLIQGGWWTCQWTPRLLSEDRYHHTYITNISVALAPRLARRLPFKRCCILLTSKQSASLGGSCRASHLQRREVYDRILATSGSPHCANCDEDVVHANQVSVRSRDAPRFVGSQLTIGLWVSTAIDSDEYGVQIDPSSIEALGNSSEIPACTPNKNMIGCDSLLARCEWVSVECFILARHAWLLHSGSLLLQRFLVLWLLEQRSALGSADGNASCWQMQFFT